MRVMKISPLIMFGLLPMHHFTIHSSLPDDHMVLTGADFKGCVPKQLTVRTATVDQLESVDSGAVRLPPALIREVTAGTARTMATEAVRAANLRKVRDENALFVIKVCWRCVFPFCHCVFFFCSFFVFCF